MTIVCISYPWFDLLDAHAQLKTRDVEGLGPRLGLTHYSENFGSGGPFCLHQIPVTDPLYKEKIDRGNIRIVEKAHRQSWRLVCMCLHILQAHVITNTSRERKNENY